MSDSATEPASEKPTPRIFSFPVLLPWAAVACCAALAALLAQRYQFSQSETELLREQIATTELALKSVQNENDAAQIIARRQLDTLNGQLAESARQLAAAHERLAAHQRELKTPGDLANLRIAVLVPTSMGSSPANAVAVWNPARQEGLLRVAQLPAPATDQDYQLWLVDPQYPSPVDGGVITLDARTGEARLKFTGRQPVASIDAFAITLGRKGGGLKPEGPFVLLGK